MPAADSAAEAEPVCVGASRVATVAHPPAPGEDGAGERALHRPLHPLAPLPALALQDPTDADQRLAASGGAPGTERRQDGADRTGDQDGDGGARRHV